uniref:Protein yippee-like n=1 Tax=Panagrolaimus sp. JU765 TaxID=591449 RepID=A0AC34R6Z6_9BILA
MTSAFFILNGFLILSLVDAQLICRVCGQQIATTADIIDTPTEYATKSYTQNVIGKEALIQTLVNPSNIKFDVVSAKKANVAIQGQSYSSDSWFSGMRWTSAVCKTCHAQLGWHFNAPAGSLSQNFYGLILNQLISKDYADSLIMAPGDGKKDSTPNPKKTFF